MTAYFTASIVGKKHYKANYEAIVSYLEKKGIPCIADHILKTTEDEINMETKQERLAFQEKLDRWITTANFVVAETSFPSISVGYEISLALHRCKPVLVLYTTDDPPSLLAHHKDERFVCEHYTRQTLPALLDDFMNYVSGASDTRFTFFITPTEHRYLSQRAKAEKLPKAVYLRKLIEEDMGKH
jgi:hypothetical protein